MWASGHNVGIMFTGFKFGHEDFHTAFVYEVDYFKACNAHTFLNLYVKYNFIL